MRVSMQYFFYLYLLKKLQILTHVKARTERDGKESVEENRKITEQTKRSKEIYFKKERKSRK